MREARPRISRKSLPVEHLSYPPPAYRSYRERGLVWFESPRVAGLQGRSHMNSPIGSDRAAGGPSLPPSGCHSHGASRTRTVSPKAIPGSSSARRPSPNMPSLVDVDKQGDEDETGDVQAVVWRIFVRTA